MIYQNRREAIFKRFYECCNNNRIPPTPEWFFSFLDSNNMIDEETANKLACRWAVENPIDFQEEDY